jgi:hypothetical protein
LAAGLPPTIRQGIWKIIDRGEINEEDMTIPHFSRNEDWVHRDLKLKNKDEWFYCMDADINKKKKTDYEAIKHLSLLSATGTGVLEVEIAMAFLIKEGKKVEDYFELKEYYETAPYERLKAMPAYYNLPKNMRDKAIEI